jgi:hypothetical protein
MVKKIYEIREEIFVRRVQRVISKRPNKKFIHQKAIQKL